jgi:hypothetical protein
MTRPELGSPPNRLVVLSQDADSPVGAATHPNPIRAVSTTGSPTVAAATDTRSAPVVGAERGSLRRTLVGGSSSRGDDGRLNTAAATVACVVHGFLPSPPVPNRQETGARSCKPWPVSPVAPCSQGGQVKGGVIWMGAGSVYTLSPSGVKPF